jgi:hypothetical protein
MNTNNPVVEQMHNAFPAQQPNPLIQNLVSVQRGLRCSPWDIVFRYVRPEQFTQEHLNYFQNVANQVRPLFKQYGGR